MNIITFNIRCGNDPDGHSVSERAPRLCSVIKKYSPDVVGFQEVTPLWEPYIPSDYQDEYEVFTKYRDISGWPEGCTLMWKKDKFTKLYDGAFWFSKTPWVSSMGNDELYRCKRFCIYAALKENSSGKTVVVYNTHFGFGDEYQIESLNLLNQTADIIGEKYSLLTGDFNMTPKSAPYKHATEMFTDANTLLENDQTTTYHGYGKENNEHIDYLFLKGNSVTPTKYKLLDESFDGKYPSDHYGLYFELDLT